VRAVFLHDAVGYETINWVGADINYINVRLQLVSKATVSGWQPGSESSCLPC